ncbi:T6SS immunity protein Tli4 family protein [Pseudomonas sp. MWU349]|uniref:T6SS immunity protein Tli4 family protein n=1 Tax=Pseudomonas sp. MWU349 TaxID=2802572 RepID=UPI001B33EFC1|nr:T6SS immunity protein Tli4 family protein [Pseudomonas sp. MWU349]
MIARRNQLFTILTALTAWACFYTLEQLNPAPPDQTHTVSKLTQSMHTQCVGRLLIDLPAGTTWAAQASGAQLANLTLSVTTGVSAQQYNELIESRWKEVQILKLDNFGTPYLRPSERVAIPGGGVVFAYEFENIDGLAEDDKTVVKKLFHQAEGFLLRNETLFKLTQSNNSKDIIPELFPRLHARADDEFPTRPGLCLSGAFVDDYYDVSYSGKEEVSWRFSLPLNLNLIVHHSKIWQPTESLLQRDKRSLGEAISYMAFTPESKDKYKQHEFRRAERQVGDLKGEEGVSGATEGESKFGYKTSISGVWEFPGLIMPSPQPRVSVRLTTPEYSTTSAPIPGGGFPVHDDLSDGPNEEQFFEIWNAIIESVRFRPEALAPPPSGGNPVNKPSSPMISSYAPTPVVDDYALEEFLINSQISSNWMDEL